MSWPIRFILILPLLLSACGFQPLYGRHAPSGAPMAGVKIQTSAVVGREAQELKSDLEDRLDPDGARSGPVEYQLNAALIVTKSAIVIAPDGTVQRYNIILESPYELIRIADGKKVTSGKLRHVTSYNNVNQAYFSTYVSEADVIRRAITELSEVYRQRLAAFLTQGKPVAGAK